MRSPWDKTPNDWDSKLRVLSLIPIGMAVAVVYFTLLSQFFTIKIEVNNNGNTPIPQRRQQ